MEIETKNKINELLKKIKEIEKNSESVCETVYVS